MDKITQIILKSVHLIFPSLLRNEAGMAELTSTLRNSTEMSKIAVNEDILTAVSFRRSELSYKVGCRLHELAAHGQREPGGGIHAI